MPFTLKIQENAANNLLGRQELKLALSHPSQATPSKAEVAKMVGTLLKTSSENVVVYDCETRFGRNVSTCYAKVYKSLQGLKGIEDKYVLERRDKANGIEKTRVTRKLRKERKNKEKLVRGTMAAHQKRLKKKQK